MNLQKWNALPEDIKKIFNEVSEKHRKMSAEKYLEMDTVGADAAAPAGHKFTFLSAEEISRWRSIAVDPLIEEWAKKMEAKGIPGKALVEFRREKAEKYFKQYGPLDLFKKLNRVA